MLIAADGPFVDVARARALTASTAVVLDARGSSAKRPFIAGANVVDWTDIRDGWLRTGRLTDEASLRKYFEKRGVRDDRPVLIYGAMGRGWGEEGRIWWTLQYLGHPRVFILNGGLQRWIEGGGPTASRPNQAVAGGRLSTPTQVRWRVDWRAVDRLRQDPEVTILDVRTRREYDGATPYWSSRGGHVPGARWLHWKSLLGADGRLLAPDALRARLAKAGIGTKTKTVVTYCTAGVRSAFVVAALAQAGFAAANYDGSWWDWSRQKVPVE